MRCTARQIGAQVLPSPRATSTALLSGAQGPPRCTMRAAILNETSSGGYEFKITRLVVSQTQIPSGGAAPSALEKEGLNFQLRQRIAKDRYF